MISPNPKDIHARYLIADFLRMYAGATLDAMDASLRMQERWGIRLDWHEFSYVLDNMNNHGGAKLTGFTSGGMGKYLINMPIDKKLIP